MRRTHGRCRGRPKRGAQLAAGSEANVAGVLDELEALKLAPVSHKASRLRPGYHKRMRDADPEQPVSNART